MTVDEILASGTYTDRHGRVWEVFGQEGDLGIGWGYWEPPFGIQAVIGTHHLRTIIERDMHRGVCGGGRLADCIQHPVPSVTRTATGEWGAYGALCSLSSSRHATFPAALDAARELAVGE